MRPRRAHERAAYNSGSATPGNCTCKACDFRVLLFVLTHLKRTITQQTSMHRDTPVRSRRRLGQLPGSSDSLALARLARSDGRLVVIAASALDAQRIVEEAAWFEPGLRGCLLP